MQNFNADSSSNLPVTYFYMQKKGNGIKTTSSVLVEKSASTKNSSPVAV